MFECNGVILSIGFHYVPDGNCNLVLVNLVNEWFRTGFESGSSRIKNPVKEIFPLIQYLIPVEVTRNVRMQWSISLMAPSMFQMEVETREPRERPRLDL